MSCPWIELTMPFKWVLVHFYQVAAAQDKLVKYNMSYIKQEIPIDHGVEFLLNQVLLLLFSPTGVVQFLTFWPPRHGLTQLEIVTQIKNTISIDLQWVEIFMRIWKSGFSASKKFKNAESDHPSNYSLNIPYMSPFVIIFTLKL